MFDALGKAPSSDAANVARWYRHIASFSPKERSEWTGSAVPQVAGGATTVAASKPADDDDVDLFGSDEEEDAEAEKIKADRVKAYSEKKSKKPALIAKSSILMDVKPWDDETGEENLLWNVWVDFNWSKFSDMKEMERLVRTIVMDGLLWGELEREVEKKWKFHNFFVFL